MMNGYNFTERVRKVLALAREESARLHHEYVGTEHILLGLLREGEGVASTVMLNVGIDVDAVASLLEQTVKRGNSATVTGPDLPYTSRAKKVLELAMAEARDLNHTYVGTEHLLLGLIREEKGIAAQVLVDAGLTLDVARAEVLRILGTETEAHSTDLAPRRMQGRLGIAAEQHPERIRNVLDESRTLAAGLGAARLEPAHVAIALLRNGDGAANVALERMSCERSLVLAALEPLAPPAGAPPSPDAPIGQSESLHEVLVAAQREQRESRAPVLGTHHLLLGLLTRPEIAAAFATHGVTADQFRAGARRVIG